MKNIKLTFFLFILIGGIVGAQDRTESIKADLPLAQIRGKYGVWYKNGVSGDSSNATNRITKPFIVCEGFDLNDEGLGFVYNGQLNQSGLLTQLRNDGYDIIILDLLDNTKSISKNSRLLQKLIKDINQEVQNNHDWYGTPVCRPMLMGISMGGD